MHANFRKIYQDAALEFAREAAGPENSHTISVSESGSSSPSSSNCGSTPGTSLPENNAQGPLLSSLHLDTDDPPIDPMTRRYLLLCVNAGMNRIKLTHLDVTRRPMDQDLFRQMKSEYEDLRGMMTPKTYLLSRKPYSSCRCVGFLSFRRLFTGM
jgi:hypothetical protein